MRKTLPSRCNRVEEINKVIMMIKKVNPNVGLAYPMTPQTIRYCINLERLRSDDEC
jgi:hypothetical protein